MTAESDWATFRDQGGVTAKRAFMAGREAGYWEGARAEIEAVYVTDITEAPTPPSPLTRAVVKASRYTWALATIGALSTGTIGIVTHSVPWSVAALMCSFVAVFSAVTAQDDGRHEHEAIQSGLVCAGAAVFIALLGATVGAVWGAGV